MTSLLTPDDDLLVDLNPDDHLSLNNLAWYMFESGLTEDYKEIALTYSKKSLELTEDSEISSYHDTLAMILAYWHNDYTKAKIHFNKCLEISRKNEEPNFEVLLHYGDFLAKCLKDYETASSIYTGALLKAETSADIKKAQNGLEFATNMKSNNNSNCNACLVM